MTSPQFNDNTLPQSPDVERAVLGAMMMDNSIIPSVKETLSPEDFYKPEHAIIFRAISDLSNDGIPVDLMTLPEKLSSRGELDLVGGEFSIAGLYQENCSTANIKYHCDILKEKSTRRSLISLGKLIDRESMEEGRVAWDIIEEFKTKLGSLAVKKEDETIGFLPDMLPQAIHEIERRNDLRGKTYGIGTGFTKLDKACNGWQKQNLIILAGKTSKGKTALALDFIKNASKDGHSVAYFSLEMSKMEILLRLVGNEARSEISSVGFRIITQTELTEIYGACQRLSQCKIHIDDTPGLRLPVLQSKLRYLKESKDIQLCVVDYLQLMGGTNNESRRIEVESISRGLKQTAKELDIPIIALSQLSRKADETDDRRPKLSDLRESGQIEQDADIVMFIHEPTPKQVEEYTNQHLLNTGSEASNIRELGIRKNRHGALSTILLHWQGSYTRFSNLDYGDSHEA